MEPGGASMQAVLLSPEICIVVVTLDNLQNIGGKADVVERTEGSSPDLVNGDPGRTPPGSENRACRHRDNSGTWEGQMSPC